MLTQERLTQLLEYDAKTGVFTWVAERCPQRPKGSRAGCKRHDGYIIIRIDRVAYLAHRLAWFYTHGVWPDSLIDHANGIRDDNRLVNLRAATALENVGNMRTKSASGIKGVIWDKTNKYWVAYIHKQRAYKFIGSYKTKQEAADARNREADAYFGAFNGGA